MEKRRLELIEAECRRHAALARVDAARRAEHEEVAEALDVKLPEDREFDTLGGLVFSQLHTIPRNGPVPDVEACGLHVHVDQVDGFRIVSATVRRCDPQEPPEEAPPAS